MECPICCNKHESFYTCETCKHVICATCREDISRENNKCPFCRAAFDEVKFYPADIIIDQKEVDIVMRFISMSRCEWFRWSKTFSSMGFFKHIGLIRRLRRDYDEHHDSLPLILRDYNLRPSFTHIVCEYAFRCHYDKENLCTVQ